MISTLLGATETFLTELNPHVPLLSVFTGIQLTAHGLARMMRQGPSKSALAETATGIALTALSYYSLDKIAQRPHLQAQKSFCDLTIAKATDTTEQVLNSTLIGGTPISISCELQENSRSFLTTLNPKNFAIHSMYNDCVVTLTKSGPIWLDQATTQLCIPITETTYRAHHFGAPDPILSRLIANFRFKILG